MATVQEILSSAAAQLQAALAAHSAERSLQSSISTHATHKIEELEEEAATLKEQFRNLQLAMERSSEDKAVFLKGLGTQAGEVVNDLRLFFTYVRNKAHEALEYVAAFSVSFVRCSHGGNWCSSSGRQTSWWRKEPGTLLGWKGKWSSFAQRRSGCAGWWQNWK